MTFSDFYDKLSRLSAKAELDKKVLEIKSNGLLGVLFDEIRKETAGRTIRTVADVGGGSGTNLYLLREFVNFEEGILLDINPVPFSSEFKVVKCDIGQRIPLPDNSVDLVLLIEVIEHVFNTDNLVVEIRRILKNNGLLVITTPNLSCILNRIMLFLGKQPLFTEVSAKKMFGRPGNDVVGHIRVFTYGSLREFLVYYRFRIKFMKTVPLFAYGRRGLADRILFASEKTAVSLKSSLGSRTIVVADLKKDDD